MKNIGYYLSLARPSEWFKDDYARTGQVTLEKYYQTHFSSSDSEKGILHMPDVLQKMLDTLKKSTTRSEKLEISH